MPSREKMNYELRISDHHGKPTNPFVACSGYIFEPETALEIEATNAFEVLDQRCAATPSAALEYGDDLALQSVQSENGSKDYLGEVTTAVLCPSNNSPPDDSHAHMVTSSKSARKIITAKKVNFILVENRDGNSRWLTRSKNCRFRRFGKNSRVKSKHDDELLHFRPGFGQPLSFVKLAALQEEEIEKRQAILREKQRPERNRPSVDNPDGCDDDPWCNSNALERALGFFRNLFCCSAGKR